MSELFANLKAYFAETYSFDYIQNFDMTDVGRFLPIAVVGLAIGVFLAVCISYYNGQFLGKVVRRLYKADAFDGGSAVTLDSVGCNNALYRRAIRKNLVLSKYVKPTEDGRFFIPEAEKYIADKRFKEVRGGIWSLVIAFFLCLVGCIFLLDAIPEVLQLADNAIGMIG